MSSLFGDLVVLAHTGGQPRLTRLPLALGAPAMDPSEAALALGRIVGGSAVDTMTVREIEIEILALTPSAQSLILRAAPALVDHAAGLQRAMHALAELMSAILAAPVPPAVIVDATLLQACRECGWDADRLHERERREELSFRLFRSVGIDVEAATTFLDAHSAERNAEEARRFDIERSIRAKLPAV